MTATEVPGTPEYVPARIRAGGKPSVDNCFGCPDEVTKVTRRGTRVRACARSGTVVYKTPAYPKWPGGGGMTDPEEDLPVKRCTHCGEEKPLDAFPRDRTSPDGRFRWCKTCNNAASREYYARKKATPDVVKPAKWVALTCETCGKEMHYRRSEIESRRRRGVPVPRFCSMRCRGMAQRREPDQAGGA